MVYSFSEYLKFFLLVTSLVLFASCNKDVPKKQKTVTTEADSSEETDTMMTRQEILSSALVQDMMGEENDEDLEAYIEDSVYPLVEKSKKVALNRLSSSLYLLSYEDNGTMKNFIIQKFYDPQEDEFIFERTETQLDAVKQFVK